jgi:hypothetical protein
MNIKDGFKTVEFWLVMASTILVAFVPDFPKESFMALIGWAGMRSTQKFFGMVDPKSGKPSWQTSEFWVTIGYATAKTVFPDMPQEALYAVLGWAGARTGVKLTTKTK